MPLFTKKARHALLLSALFLFFLGFLSGYVVKHLLDEIDGEPESSSFVVLDGSAEAEEESGESVRETESFHARGASPRDAGSRRSSAESDDAHEDEPSDRKQILARLEAAIASGDESALENALDELVRSSGEPLDEEELSMLEGLLADGDPRLLHFIARALVIAGDKRGVEIVMSFLESNDNSLSRRGDILDSLEHLPADRASLVTAELVDFLASGPHRELEQRAAKVFGHLHGDRGVESLLGLLDGGTGISPDVLFEAMGSVGEPGDVAAMIQLMGGDWSREQRDSLMTSIGRASLRDGNNTDTLMGLLKEQAPGMSQQMVADAIHRLSHRLDADFLSRALREVPSDPGAQESIARALAGSGGKEGLEMLFAAASDPEFRMDQRAFARALEDCGGSEGLPAMLDMLRSSHDESIVEPLARGLSRNGNSDTVRSLIDLLDTSSSPEQRRAVARALEDSNRTGLPQDRLLDLIARETDSEVARELGNSLERLYPKLVEEQAESLFDNASSAPERLAYARLLNRQEPTGSVDKIADQLGREPDREVSWEMAYMLGRSDDGIRRAADIIVSDADNRRRHNILWGLEAGSRPGSAAAKDLFLRVAGSDRSADMRSQAAEILARRGDASVLPQLRDILGREIDARARERIQESIRRLDRESSR